MLFELERILAAAAVTFAGYSLGGVMGYGVRVTNLAPSRPVNELRGRRQFP